MKAVAVRQRNVPRRPGLRSLDTRRGRGRGIPAWPGHLHPATVKKRLNQPRVSKQSPSCTWLEPVTTPLVIARRGTLDNNGSVVVPAIQLFHTILPGLNLLQSAKARNAACPPLIGTLNRLLSRSDIAKPDYDRR